MLTVIIIINKLFGTEFVKTNFWGLVMMIGLDAVTFLVGLELGKYLTN